MSLFSNEDLPPVPIADQLAEIERELDLRRKWYPIWQQNGKIRPVVANERMRRMEATRDSLVELADIKAGMPKDAA